MAVVACVGILLGAIGARAADVKPYDDKLVRLSEILGAVHYLRELCGSNDGQLWRERMKELMDAEGSSALRRALLTRSF
ncbi:MAG: TIGR02301 family protein, partial [Hyphomicrobiaceae bacterium]